MQRFRGQLLGRAVGATVAACALVAALAGCGSRTVVVGDSPPTPYDGPMSMAQDFADDASVERRAGAAARALECEHPPYAGGGGDYADSGLETVRENPSDALEEFLDQQAWLAVPSSGYRIERDDGDRVLFSFDVDDHTTVAFIAADDIRDFNDDIGWGIESWAQCDPAELPAEVTDDLPVQVWEDESGARVPVTTVRSFPGAEHCDWQDLTFLEVGQTDDAQQYVGGGAADLRDWLATTYDATADLPERATDSGFRRDGRELWLVPSRDAAYLVSIDAPEDVERWPAATEPILCA